MKIKFYSTNCLRTTKIKKPLLKKRKGFFWTTISGSTLSNQMIHTCKMRREIRAVLITIAFFKLYTYSKFFKVR